MRYLLDGHLEVENSLAEDAIRRFAVGRKAWLFSGSPRGAKASAMLYPLVETGKAKGLEPRAYLYYLFESLPTVTMRNGIQVLPPHGLPPELFKISAPAL